MDSCFPISLDACECCLCVFIIKGPVTIVSGPPCRFHCHHCHLITSLKDIISTSNHIPIYQRLEISTDEIVLDNIIQDICSMKSGFVFRIIYHQRESQLRHSFILSPSFPLSLSLPLSLHIPLPSPHPQSSSLFPHHTHSYILYISPMMQWISSVYLFVWRFVCCVSHPLCISKRWLDGWFIHHTLTSLLNKYPSSSQTDRRH